MRLKQVCQRCGRTFSEVHMEGGDPGIQRFLLGMSGMSTSRSLCPHCGGTVRGVTDDQELPREFRVTRPALLRAACFTALGWACFSFGVGMAAQSPESLEQADSAMQRAFADSSWTLVCANAAIGSVIGVVFTLVAAFLASRRDDLDDPAPTGAMPFGQAAAMMPMLLLGLGAGAAMAMWLVPLLAGDQVPLRSLHVRGIIGGVIGLLAASWGHYSLFKACRASADQGSST